MKYTTFMARVEKDNSVKIPVETRENLDLRQGDNLEVTIKKVKARRLDILINQNPLYKLLKFSEE